MANLKNLSKHTMGYINADKNAFSNDRGFIDNEMEQAEDAAKSKFAEDCSTADGDSKIALAAYQAELERLKLEALTNTQNISGGEEGAIHFSFTVETMSTNHDNYLEEIASDKAAIVEMQDKRNEKYGKESHFTAGFNSAIEGDIV